MLEDDEGFEGVRIANKPLRLLSFYRFHPGCKDDRRPGMALRWTVIL